jgi:uncharacterized repeat protein (TIGR03803 family)
MTSAQNTPVAKKNPNAEPISSFLNPTLRFNHIIPISFQVPGLEKQADCTVPITMPWEGPTAARRRPGDMVLSHARNSANSATKWAEEVDFRGRISPESGDMDIVRQSTKGARRLRRLSDALAMALAISVPCSAATAPAATPPTLTTLYSFQGGNSGSFLEAGLVLNSTTGVLYGTTAEGGKYGWGTVYQLVPGTGGTWTQTVIYNFNPIGIPGDGASPQANLILGTSGVLYGTTAYGGGSDDGTVFSLSPAGGGAWTEKVIHSFTGPGTGGTGADGADPEAGLVLASSTGVLYGTTYSGGASGLGTVFQLTPATGGTWTERVLYNFAGSPGDGSNPVTGLALATSQVLYGTTYTGGALGYGTVFQLVPSGGGVWTESPIYSFGGTLAVPTNGIDGIGPEGGLTIHYVKTPTGGTSNILYGTTFWAGVTPVGAPPPGTGCPLGGYPAGCGTAFSLTPPATTGAPWTFGVLYTFKGTGSDGAHPSQNMSLNSSGVLYGTTFSGGSTNGVCFGASYPGCGTVFILRPPATSGAAWTESVVHDFNGDDGGGPNGVIPDGTSGIYYGATYNGGTSGGYGTVFQLTPQ